MARVVFVAVAAAALVAGGAGAGVAAERHVAHREDVDGYFAAVRTITGGDSASIDPDTLADLDAKLLESGRRICRQSKTEFGFAYAQARGEGGMTLAGMQAAVHYLCPWRESELVG